MAKLKNSDILHVAKLAKLNLSENEIKKFQKQLGEIITYVNELNEVDTSGVEPTSQTTKMENVSRKDKKEISLDKDLALSQVDESYNNYFIVPIILEEKDI